MINKTNHPNFKNPSFSEDSKTFQSLILDKGFREKVAKKIIEWIVNNPEINADDFDRLIIYWNRFNNELVTVKKDCVYNSYPFDNDLLSHFTVVSIRAFLLEYWGTIIHSCGVENENNGNLIDEILEILEMGDTGIDKTFQSWYPLILSGYSHSDEDGDIFLELEKLFSDWIMVPLDFLSDEDQFLSFWDSFDLFREDDGGTRAFLPLFSRQGVTVSRFILNENFSLKEPFCYYENKLIDYSINQLKDCDSDCNLSMFNASLRFLDKLLKSGSDRSNQILEEVSLFEEKLTNIYQETIKEVLENSLYYETYFSNVFKVMNTPLVLPPEVFGIDKVQEKIISLYIEFLEENGSSPADYVSNLPEIIYQKAKEKNLLVETVKRNSNSCEESFDGPVIYSPIRADLSIVSAGEYYISFPLTDIEDMLIKTNSKTTKTVKETIETVLKIKTLKLSQTVKSHLEFVLSMDTID